MRNTTASWENISSHEVVGREKNDTQKHTRTHTEKRVTWTSRTFNCYFDCLFSISTHFCAASFVARAKFLAQYSQQRKKTTWLVSKSRLNFISFFLFIRNVWTKTNAQSNWIVGVPWNVRFDNFLLFPRTKSSFRLIRPRCWRYFKISSENLFYTLSNSFPFQTFFFFYRETISSLFQTCRNSCTVIWPGRKMYTDIYIYVYI